MDELGIVITSKKTYWDFNWRAIWNARDLVRVFIYRDFTARFKQTILGPLWFVISPLLMSFIYTFVFNTVAGIPTDGMHPLVFYYGGILGWNYFAAGLNSSANIFISNYGLFSKVYFPRLISPIAALFSNGLQFLIQWLTFYLLCLALWLNGSEFQLGWEAVFIPLLVIPLALLAFGFGSIISSVTVKYRDLNHLLSFGVQLWMYATPIVYPSSKLPPKFAFIAEFNPVAPFIETIRFCLSGIGVIPWRGLLIASIITVLVTFLGLLVFNRVEKDFIDVA
ncbi:MAG: lipopolysaccharide transport system permease protein [Luteibaculaceae bacterium]|jgi:lipopolysaccharide transport system permease protein